MATSLIGSGSAEAASVASPPSDPVTTPPVAGLHLQFGADASSEMVVSWHTLQSVQNPRVVLGHLDGKLAQTVAAQATSYTDAKAGQRVYAWHAKLGGLQPDSTYLYAAMHDGAAPVAGPELGEGQSGAALDARGMLHERHVDGRAREEPGGEQGNELGDRHVTLDPHRLPLVEDVEQPGELGPGFFEGIGRLDHPQGRP